MRKFSFLPRQDSFLADLSALAGKANQSAALLKKYVDAEEAGAQANVIGEIDACRADSKAIMAKMTDDLARSFVTPFDREDIQLFSQNLYRIPKMIEKVVQRMKLHGLSGGREDFCRQVDLIVEEAAAMGEIIDDLLLRRNTRQVTEKVSLLHALEQKGDDILQGLLEDLFSRQRDMRDMILRKDIYDMLEKVVDAYRNAAAVALQIVLKYS